MHTVCKVMSFCIVQYSVMWCNVYNVLYFSLTSIWEHKFVGGLIKNRTHPWSRRWDVGMCWLLTYMGVRGFPSLWPCLWPCSKAKITWSIINNFCPCLLSAVIHGAARTAIVVCPSSLTTWDPKGIKQSRKLRKAPVVLRHKWLGPTAG